MDSPLLPTLQRNRHSSEEMYDDDPSSLIGIGGIDDLSLTSDAPLSPEHSVLQLKGKGQARFADADVDEEGEGSRNSQYTAAAGRGGRGGTNAKAKPRFSLFAAPASPAARQAPPEQHDDEEEEEDHRDRGHDEQTGGGEEDQTIHARPSNGTAGESSRREPQPSSAERDARLRESLYELRQMNEVFDGFLGALEGVRGHNERLAERVRQTSKLLDEYTAIMGQAEHTQQLLLNPRWTGSIDDAAALAAEEEARLAARAAAEAEAQRAAEAARQAEEDRERRAAEAARMKELTGGGGARGRGRGRGVAGGAGVGVGRGRGAGAGGGVPARGRVPSSGTGIPRPSLAPARPSSGSGSAPSARRTVSGTTSASGGGGAVGGGGLGGQYSHVKSSGYGPPRRS